MGKIELKKHSRGEYSSKSMAQCQELYELWMKAGFIKGTKAQESSRTLEAKVAMLEAKENSSNESIFPDEKSKANDINN